MKVYDKVFNAQATDPALGGSGECFLRAKLTCLLAFLRENISCFYKLVNEINVLAHRM